MGKREKGKRNKNADVGPGPEFRAAGKTDVQDHKQTLYAVCWGDDVHVDKAGVKYHYLASCGSKTLTIYEVEKDNPRGSFETVQVYNDKTDNEEIFFACAFAGRSAVWKMGKSMSKSAAKKEEGISPKHAIEITGDEENNDTSQTRLDKRPRTSTAAEPYFTQDEAFSKGTLSFDFIRSSKSKNYLNRKNDPAVNNGPQLVCVAGGSGVIKVIDPVQKKLVAALSGHGSDVYDLKKSPASDFLILSASVDESIRLWTMDTFACLAIFAGLHGHLDPVLSLSWHHDGLKFASGGMDKSIRLWDTGSHRVPEAIKASTTKMHIGGKRGAFRPLVVQYPYFATKQVHLNFVDCVQFLGDTILSRSTYNSIVHWAPKLPAPGSVKAGATAYTPPNEVIALRVFEMNYCHLWFVRFAIDTRGKWLSVGNTKGEVEIWDMDSPDTQSCQKIVPSVESTIRMLAFSPDGQTLVACNDGATICRWVRKKQR